MLPNHSQRKIFYDYDINLQEIFVRDTLPTGVFRLMWVSGKPQTTFRIHPRLAERLDAFLAENEDWNKTDFGQVGLFVLLAMPAKERDDALIRFRRFLRGEEQLPVPPRLRGKSAG